MLIACKHAIYLICWSLTLFRVMLMFQEM